IDLVLNVACNKAIEPADATCCLGSGIEISAVQIITGIIFLTCAIATFFVGRKVRISLSQPQNPQNLERSSDSPLYHPYVVLKNLSKFGLILAYFYICDRTPIFMKEAKVYGLGSFLACLGVLFLVGIASGKEASKADYLNRDQTDEWKGWMQLIILAYHYLGASADLRVYVWIRVLVASYLFMSAYGHFNYFWNKGDYSLYRFSQVMLRMNLLTVLLCYTMNRPYQFYYFMPLISFFYVLVYLTHVAWPQVDASKAKDGKNAIWLMLGKIGVLAIVCGLLWKSMTIFSALFSWWPLVELFRAEKEVSLVREWWFRSGLDRFMAPYGMLFAFILLLAKNFKLINTDSTQWPLRSIFSWIILLLSSAAMLGYGYFSVTCPNKPDCNASHSWISFLPITAFVFLRNVPPFLRSQYSAFFAWTGKISLELFIGQYHIWLANDTHSLLVVIPGYPLVNAVVTTFVFVCAAHEISSICGVLTSYAVTKDTRAMLKRIAAVAVALTLTLLLHVLTKKY
ncbi:N-acetylneuraminate 9-O-acetyltransferase-like, partial [Oscarella lobularis]|uniref:N-acetylneuraminate 9-O-acetyltransferase-like n=1 Tax=Oscarella lobularis TaxID=121494 RepID=UPI0033132AF3